MTSSPRLNFLAAALAIALAGCNCGGPPTSTDPDSGIETPDDGGTNTGTDGGADDGGTDDGGVTCPPAPRTGTPLASGLAAVRRLAVDDTFVYATVSSDYSNDVGRVIRINRAGGLVEEVANDLTAPDAVTVDPATGIPYVLDQGGVWRIDTTAKTRTRIDTSLTNALYGETALAITGDAVLIATGFRALSRAKLDGSGATTLFLAPAGSVVRGLTIAGGEAYFLVALGPAPGIYKVPADGSASAERVRDEPEDGHALMIDGENFVWSEGDQNAGKIVAAPITGGDATVLAADLVHPFRILKLNGALYFKDATSGPVTAAFLRVIDECGPHAVGPEGIGPGDLVEKDGVLFFSSEDFAGQGYISRLP